MVKPDQLEKLVEAGAIQEAVAIAEGRWWRCEVRTGMTRQAVATRRGQVRYWSRLDTLAGYLRDRGIGRWCVDASTWTPEQREVV